MKEMIKILFFGEAEDVVGIQKLILKPEEITESSLHFGKLIKHLFEIYPQFQEFYLKRFPTVKFALNREYIEEEILNLGIKSEVRDEELYNCFEKVLIHSGDEIAIIPPVSGG